MQWLIDLVAARVIDTIGIPPVFIDAGEPVPFQMNTGDFIADYTWRDIDLSGVVPVGTKGVLWNVVITTPSLAKYLILREGSRINHNNEASVGPVVVGVQLRTQMIVALDENRVCQYRTTINVWNRIQLFLSAWWM